MTEVPRSIKTEKRRIIRELSIGDYLIGNTVTLYPELTRHLTDEDLRAVIDFMAEPVAVSVPEFNERGNPMPLHDGEDWTFSRNTLVYLRYHEESNNFAIAEV